MSRSVMLVPAGQTAGIFTASLGLVQALTDKGVKTALFHPLSACCKCAEAYGAISVCTAAKLLGNGQSAKLYETVVSNFAKFKAENPAAVYVIEGIQANAFDKDVVNAAIAHALDADLVVVSDAKCKAGLNRRNITLAAFGNAGKNRVLGTVILNADAPADAHGRKSLVLAGCGKCGCACKSEEPAEAAITDIVAEIAYDKQHYAYRASELAHFLNGEIVAGCPNARGFKLTFGEAHSQHQILVTDTLPAATEAGIVILTNGVKGELAGKTVISVKAGTWEVAKALAAMPVQLPADDKERIELNAKDAAKAFCPCFINKISAEDPEHVQLFSPAAFRHKLTELARSVQMRIALPEGTEPRTVKAAAAVAEQGIAIPVLFGKADEIAKVAAEQGVTLPSNVQIIDPEQSRGNYVARLVELRKKKGLTPEQAAEMLKDNVVLATMMIERNEVDGLVSGAVHTTANTIRPPLQIIKTAPGAKLVSSVFFMLMPEQVWIFGDCAINPNPDAAQLAEIAIQSADTAKAFGIVPRVAMITYSTINSGKGPDVDLVIEATKLAKAQRPDLEIDGPLQFDAAVMPNVAAQKAPGSKVAGKATVFIFPSLACGNTVYKAVQRSANLVAIGPMLQGMRKPVNDLSRGALVDDIIYTIAITAIQAQQAKNA